MVLWVLYLVLFSFDLVCEEFLYDCAKFICTLALRFGRLGYLCAATGTLKGYDQLLNLVLDRALESVRGVSSFSSHYILCTLTT